MKKRKYIILAALFIMAFVSFRVSQTRVHKADTLYSLLDIEKQAVAENIDYGVPGKSNNPKGCTLEVWVGANGSITDTEVGVNGHYKTVQGMKNFCSGSGEKCDPYNCHQRL